MTFGVRESNMLKGLAMLMLLAHHVFTAARCSNSTLLHLGSFCKICVPMFLFVSGYGIVRSGYGLRRVLFVRLPKLFINFWFVAIIFISIDVMFFGRSLVDVYGASKYPISHFLLQMVGLELWNPSGGFNPTWWYISAIVPLYLLSPVLVRLVKLNPLLSLCLSIVMFKFNVPRLFLVFPQCISAYMLGIVASETLFFEKIEEDKQKIHLAIIAITCVLIAFAFHKGYSEVDAFIALAVVVLVVLIQGHFVVITRLLERMGKNSMNVFLCHTFFLRWLFTNPGDLNPIVQFLILVVASLGVSLVLNHVKGLIKLDRVVSSIGNLVSQKS